MHLASPMSRGLFHRAIVLSGPIMTQLQHDNLNSVRAIAQKVNCPTGGPSEIVECLREVKIFYESGFL